MWHPIENYGESVEQTWRNIGPFVKHIHLKDADNGQLKMLGYGTLPIGEILQTLKQNDFDGYLTLEWTKRWNEELEDAGVVFAHFIYMAKKLWKAVT